MKWPRAPARCKHSNVCLQAQKTVTMIRKAEKIDKESIQYLIKELTGHSISDSDMENRFDIVEFSQIDSLYVYEQYGF